MNELMLVRKEMFGAVECDFCRNENGDVLMTRNQIGKALEYNDPMKQIGKIHERHQDRLDKFSFVKVTNERNMYFYTAKGIYELCRWSRQPKANDFYDWVYNILEGLRTGELQLTRRDSYMIENSVERAKRWIEEQEEFQEVIREKNDTIYELQESKGLDALQVARAVRELKRKIFSIKRKPIFMHTVDFVTYKAKVFDKFGVTKWESIPDYKFAELIEYIRNIK